jgi:hypothetical protein
VLDRRQSRVDDRHVEHNDQLGRGEQQQRRERALRAACRVARAPAWLSTSDLLIVWLLWINNA